MHAITWDDIVSQRHKFGSAFLLYFSCDSKIGLFFNFPVSRACPKNCVIFIGCNFESPISQVGLHKQKKNTALAKDGKVILLCSGGQSVGCALTYGARSPEVTKTWP